MQFPKILTTLLTEGRFSGTRKELCARVGISPSLLSQFTLGQTKPSFDTLLRLAQVLEVSLDYLVFGVERRAQQQPVDYGPMARHIDLTLARLQAENSQRADLVARIGRALSEQIDQLTDEVIRRSPSAAGMLGDDEAMELETYSTETWIISVNLQYDLYGIVEAAPWQAEPARPSTPRGGAAAQRNNQEASPPLAAAGRFFPVVVSNLNRSARYRFLLPSAARDWRPVVQTYRQLLLKECASQQLVHNNCVFRLTSSPTTVGCTLYQLDLGRLQREALLLLERVRHAVSDGWLGYSIPPSTAPQASPLMDRFHLRQAQRAFADLWRRAQRI